MLRWMAVMIILIAIILAMAAKAEADIANDREECANQLVGLATCLPFVGGEARAPTSDCCSGLRQVLQKSKKCLCVLVKDRNDPSIGLKINATLALSLPAICQSPANVSQCPELLHLPPNSPDAKTFQDFANGAKGIISNTTSPPASGSSDGSRAASIKSEAAAQTYNTSSTRSFLFHLLSALLTSSLLLAFGCFPPQSALVPFPFN
ncbi:non-specific lipid transfer protein GPI-anchored 14-like [Diospyros lotus]|uniref:non-specific lipid transfer protein GPI-anchored 14-like n=1 Tax=Diospyros lotus TaxID=55363 RepID=UPI00224CAEA4|nr:non-specific lipid transfer protein GPI-anchored 14-like [Diospyros lotus]